MTDSVVAAEHKDVAVLLLPGVGVVLDHLGDLEDTEVPLTNVACYVRAPAETTAVSEVQPEPPTPPAAVETTPSDLGALVAARHAEAAAQPNHLFAMAQQSQMLTQAPMSNNQRKKLAKAAAQAAVKAGK